MKSFFAGDWEKGFGLPLLYEEQARVASCLSSNFSGLAHSPCPFTPGKTIMETHFVFLGLAQVGTEPLTLLKWDQLCRSASVPLISEFTRIPLAMADFA